MATTTENCNNQIKERLFLNHLISRGVNDVFKLRDLTNLSRASIYRIKKNIAKKGNVSRKPGSGRPRKFSPRDIQKLKHQALNHPKKSAAEIGIRLVELGCPELSPRSIRNNLTRIGLRKFKTRSKPMLSQRHKDARLQWCLDHQDVNWDLWVFSDESYCELFRNKLKYWGYKARYLPKPSRSPGIMIWGAISINGVSPLYIGRGSINSEKYCEILGSYLLPTMPDICDPNWVFQQDNARPHISKYTREWLAKNDIKVMPWPACSPDLNIIEQVWAVIKNRIEKIGPKKMPDFVEIIEKVWNEFGENHEMIENYFKSMPDRIRRCIAAKGDYFVEID